MGGEFFHARPTWRMPPRTILTALLALLLLPAVARAGTYDVYSCRLPDGSPAPARAWEPVTTYAGVGAAAVTADDCAAGGAMTASLPFVDPARPGTGAGWRFSAPEATTVS